MPHVAFIGLGRMGHGMAGRYLDAGFTLAVWNRSQAKAADLIARGARWAASPADAAEGGRGGGRRRWPRARAEGGGWGGGGGGGGGGGPRPGRGPRAIECSTVS